MMAAGSVTRRVLIIVTGLLRTHRHTWPVLERQLRLDEREASGQLVADVAVLTSLGVSCSAKDDALGTCPRDYGHLSAAAALESVNRTYGRRLRYVMDWDVQAHSIARGTALERRLLLLVGSLAERARMPPNAPGVLGGVYDIVLALRADVVLVGPGGPGSGTPRALDDIDLLALCAQYPGASYISGTIVRRMWFHDRDWDAGLLLCPPATVADWLLLSTQPDDRCRESAGCQQNPPQPPTRPPHLTGAWDSPTRRKDNMCTAPAPMLCDRVRYFQRRGVRIDALPETVVLAHVVRYTLRNGSIARPLSLCSYGPAAAERAGAIGKPGAAPPCAPFALARAADRDKTALGGRPLLDSLGQLAFTAGRTRGYPRRPALVYSDRLRLSWEPVS